VFRYLMPESRQAAAQRLGVWWRNKIGKEVKASDFPGPGDGALTSWRSQGNLDSNLVGALVIRVDPEAYEEPVRSQYVADGFLGAVALCGHLCCTPVYRMGDDGYHAGHWDDVVCDCHGSWYDPDEIREYTFPPTG
jgi:Rieske Fe-S protein